MIKLIVAIAPGNLIGNNANMAWHIKEEFIHFKNTTLNHSLLFGQNTFLNLPKKLKNRTIYVFGFTKTLGADFSITSKEELNCLFAKFKNSQEILFIAGGKFIYENFYQEADELIISELKSNQKGNVYLEWDLSKYKKTFIKEYDDFIVYSYTR